MKGRITLDIAVKIYKTLFGKASTVKKHSKQLITCKTSIQISNMDYIVYTDTKWLDFILGQVISNRLFKACGDISPVARVDK